MGFKFESDYKLNKNTKDIVYRYVTGEMDRYKKELDASGKPTGRILLIHTDTRGRESTRALSESEMTVEQFDQVKAFSDADYHKSEKGDVYKWIKAISLTGLEDSPAIEYSPSAEDEFFRSYEIGDDEAEEFRTMDNAMAIMDSCLTKTQKRRFVAYYYDRKTMDEIASHEGVDRRAVGYSIAAANRKIKKFLRDASKLLPKTPQKL